MENLLERTAELKGKLQENLRTYREQALLSKRLATINCAVPCVVDLESLKMQPPNERLLKQLLAEFEFKSIARRLFPEGDAPSPALQQELPELAPAPAQALKARQDVPHDYRVLEAPGDVEQAVQELRRASSLAFHVQTDGKDPKDPKTATIRAIAFSTASHSAVCVAIGAGGVTSVPGLQELLESEEIEKVGHGLKFACLVLRWQGVQVRGRFFDTEIAHALVEPDLRHQLSDVAGTLLQYQYVPEDLTPDAAAEAADLAWQCRAVLESRLKAQEQEKVFFEIEMPLLPVLVDMEFEWHPRGRWCVEAAF